LSSEEIDLVLQTLVFDGKLEEVKHSVAALTGHGGKVYKVSSPIHPPNYYSNVPCGVCPVFDQCRDGGIISPQTCVYMTQWLAMEPSEGSSDLQRQSAEELF
jgi:DNA-directed RNA polymerase III subunit RPC6